MTTPTINTVKSAGSRFYVHPQSAEKFIGVTSVVGMLPKGFLTWWAAKVTAETAVEQIGKIETYQKESEERHQELLHKLSKEKRVLNIIVIGFVIFAVSLLLS